MPEYRWTDTGVQNMGVSQILYLYENIWVRENPYSGIFYIVGCIKRDSSTGVSLQIYKIFKNLFLHNTSGRTLLKLLSFSFVSVVVLTYIYDVFKRPH